ncbi:DUF167 domain-containing protein [Agrobacterium rhizogenes]|uniref:UPF0235 protein Arad_4365 n=1 Tax=Rhizobium rhizogenes (strain K84 / ATCC BAA-868) TaxID=311403 RepID=B9JCH8_RHIR8|nr:DUF167 domain-containing protein [Rhizobium rhizogenes]ACM28089.1 conserved hypothetical protein [Rhizobium rhizogenes K84]KAA6485473.1 DUF167 domain-containing protein [Agrobacterium sp. ICMP 7243]OCI94844.1 hypothetical protein A6U85_18195 [Agrobacterium sp. 13-626]OCJ08840.1 hypothetical protein A6U88_23880 [Agrobacterium sp. B131/95]OCJ14230.1 hypothetical protein A6U89_23685 [Agrobacterium sp. B133/95]
MNGAWQAFADHVRLSVRLTPNGGRDAVDGIETGADGEAYLKARVSAVPEKGKANKALIALLAKRLSIPKSSLSLISGDTARKKILRIDGDPEDLIGRLKAIVKD